ncbi:electron transfer flavoprotein alpha/beta subunit [Sporomusaceae bacterium BoRhaA]|nr:electron transfer flavoprotein alpha/beta subunit [Pelorhabdus rhamnosifermentans]
MAEHLGIAQITCCSKFEVTGDVLKVEREHEEGYEVIEGKMPLLVTVVKSANEPRFATVRGTMKANRKEIPVLTLADLDVDEKRLGLKGSPTQVKKIFTPPTRSGGEMIQAEDAREAVGILLQKLSDAKII